MRHPNDEDDENLVPYVAYDAVVPSAVAPNTGKIADENLAATRISATFEMSMFSTVRLNVPAVLVRLKKPVSCIDALLHWTIFLLLFAHVYVGDGFGRAV
ncbi:hypothetical protein SAMN05216348_10465 [Olsenella sp. KH3B4]|uniref:hypothetical protein n=1 Tax=Olsenella sp. KH3B4 TaxID=1855394 RepID=UPI0008BE86A4|nr:hypothetical protein [Olsenella sp. KH3B4]SES90719.1 hypothetical protein SAMN05216348_10465 [Olsenella sp. KH3B4]